MVNHLKDICNLIMNMDPRVRFVGVLDEDGKLIEGGMKKNIHSLLLPGKDDLFYLRTVSQLKELENFTNDLGNLVYVNIRMDKVSFVVMHLDDEDGGKILLISMEPDTNPSFIIPSIKNAIVE